MFTALFGVLFGRWRGAFIALLCIAVYTLLVGAGASVVRAALMGGISLFAVQLGRRQAGLNTLAFVAYHFRRLSLVALPANAAILPAQPPLMVLGGLSLLVGLVFEPLGQLATYLAWPFAAYTIRMAELFAALPGSSVALGQVALLWVALSYIALFGLTIYWNRLHTWVEARTGGRPFNATLFGTVILALLGLAAVLVWQAYFSAPDGRLHLTLLDVGSGDALLVQTPDGRSLLVDGGPGLSRLSAALGRRLPLTQRSLDWLVVALPGKTQTVSLSNVLEGFPPANVAWAGPTHGTREDRTLQEYLVRQGIAPVMTEPRQSFDLGKGAALQVLTVGRRGASLLLEWGNFRLLLPPGANIEDIESLEYGRSVGRVSSLLLGDAGYAPSNPPEWIANLQPQVVLLSVSAADQDGLPSPDTLELLQGYTILRTDRTGWIELTTEGEQIWVEAARIAGGR